MKPTHILVPIDRLHVASQYDEVTNTMVETSFIVAAIDVIQVDLSEEGIADRALAYALKEGIDSPYYLDQCKKDYSQGAKDLLNTKP